jgi:hypothetical protein
MGTWEELGIRRVGVTTVSEEGKGMEGKGRIGGSVWVGLVPSAVQAGRVGFL